MVAKPSRNAPWQLGYSVRRYFVDSFHFRNVPRLRPGARVLDLGGHKAAKRGRFDIGRFDLDVLYLNLVPERAPDILADAAAVPLAAKSVDAVICAELLEHVYRPEKVICESHRVLKGGGTLLVTVPFLFPVHGDPQDYGRYTHLFLRMLLEESGFVDIEVEQHGGFFAVMACFLKLYANGLRIPFPFGRPVSWLLTYWLIGPIQFCAMLLEKRIAPDDKSLHRSFTTGYGIVAVKVS